MPSRVARIGQLRHQVSVQEPSRTQDAYGQDDDPSFSTTATMWARIEPANGTEGTDNDATTGIVTHNVVLRNETEIASIAPDWQLVYGTRTFSVVSVVDDMESGQWLRLLCKETTGRT